MDIRLHNSFSLTIGLRNPIVLRENLHVCNNYVILDISISDHTLT